MNCGVHLNRLFASPKKKQPDGGKKTRREKGKQALSFSITAVENPAGIDPALQRVAYRYMYMQGVTWCRDQYA